MQLIDPPLIQYDAEDPIIEVPANRPRHKARKHCGVLRTINVFSLPIHTSRLARQVRELLGKPNNEISAPSFSKQKRPTTSKPVAIMGSRKMMLLLLVRASQQSGC